MNNKDQSSRLLVDEKIQLGPFPVHRLKRVEQPTTVVTDHIPRFKASEDVFCKSISDIILFGISTHVRKWQNSN